MEQVKKIFVANWRKCYYFFAFIRYNKLWARSNICILIPTRVWMKLVGWLVHRVWLVHRCSRCSNVSTLKFHVETEDTKPEINLYCYYYKENYSYNDAKQKVIRVFVYTCTCANKKQYCHNETQDGCNGSTYQVD